MWSFLCILKMNSKSRRVANKPASYTLCHTFTLKMCPRFCYLMFAPFSLFSYAPFSLLLCSFQWIRPSCSRRKQKKTAQRKLAKIRIKIPARSAQGVVHLLQWRVLQEGIIWVCSLFLALIDWLRIRGILFLKMEISSAAMAGRPGLLIFP